MVVLPGDMSFNEGVRTFQTGNGILFGGEVYDAELAGAALALQAAISKR